MNLNFNLNFWK